MSKDTKITVSTGCTDFLVGEVESLRRTNEILGAQMRIVDKFFGLVDRLGDKPSQGYSQDLLWQAKQEIKKAMDDATAPVNA